jgi:hypothetical protein
VRALSVIERPVPVEVGELESPRCVACQDRGVTMQALDLLYLPSRDVAADLAF